MQREKGIKIKKREWKIKLGASAECTDRGAASHSTPYASVWLVNWLGGRWCNSPPHLFGSFWRAPMFPSILLRVQPIHWTWDQSKIKMRRLMSKFCCLSKRRSLCNKRGGGTHCAHKILQFESNEPQSKFCCALPTFIYLSLENCCIICRHSTLYD